jgi:hypothetical protein
MQEEEEECNKFIENDEFLNYLIHVKSTIPLRMKYVIGRRASNMEFFEKFPLQTCPLTRKVTERAVDFCVKVYRETWIVTHDTVVCWLLCAKQMRLINDVARIIGKLIWKEKVWENIKPRLTYSDNWWNK